MSRKAAALADDALDAGAAMIGAGADEADILAAMQGAVLKGGGDYPGNEFIIGSGADALLCRYKSGRRQLAEHDQITLEFAGVWRHYHAALMRTVIVGKPTPAPSRAPRRLRARRLPPVEEAMRPGATFGDVFDAHARVMDAHGLTRTGSTPAATRSAPASRRLDGLADVLSRQPGEIVPDMMLFAHMILMDSDTGAAMCLGRTYLTTAERAGSRCRRRRSICDVR